MLDGISQWISGADYNAQNITGGATSNQAVITVATGAAIIFSQIGANAYVQPSRFKPEDVVIPEHMRDNRAYITAGVAALLLLAAGFIIYWKS